MDNCSSIICLIGVILSGWCLWVSLSEILLFRKKMNKNTVIKNRTPNMALQLCNKLSRYNDTSLYDVGLCLKQLNTVYPVYDCPVVYVSHAT